MTFFEQGPEGNIRLQLMVAICGCFFVFFLCVPQLLFEGCLELQPELVVTRYWISGFHIGSSVDFGQYIGLLDTI